MKKKVIAIITTAIFIFVLFFVFFKFFLNVATACIVAFVIVVALTILILRFFKKKDVIENGYIDFFENNWVVVLFSIFFCWGGLCLLFLYIEDIPPEKIVETIPSQRLPNSEITKRMSCESIQRFIKYDVSVDTIKHYRYKWGVMRNHDDTIAHKEPSYAYKLLGQEYNLMPETFVDGYKIKCGEKIIVDEQKRYFEGSKYKPFTRLVIKSYDTSGIKTYSKFENEPQSENNESNLYDLFFDGAYAQWRDTISVPQFYCSLPAAPTKIQQILETLGNRNDYSQPNYYSTQAEAFAHCDVVCKKSADNLLSGFNYTEYKACLSTIEVYRTYKRIERSCGTAKITVNRKRGFLSRRPYSCNSTGIWEMVKE